MHTQNVALTFTDLQKTKMAAVLARIPSTPVREDHTVIMSSKTGGTAGTLVMLRSLNTML